MAIAQQKLLSVHFHSLKGLKDLEIEFRQGGLTGIFGINGSGKSTIIHAVACIYKGISENFIMSQFFTPTTHGKWQGSSFTVKYSHINPPTQTNVQVFTRVYRKAAQRWVPEYKKRLEREVRFIGINTCVPDIESETHLSLINFNSREQVDDTSKKILEKMSFIMNKKYDKHTLNQSWKKTYIGVESGGINYSALSMGAGEQRVFRILKTVLSSPKYSLILIDEIDLLLHSSALHNLLTVLIEEAQNKNQQIIFTSHRQEILTNEKIDFKHIYQTPTKTLCLENTTPECITRLTGKPERVIDIFVEDDLSEAIMSQIAEELSIRSYVSINRFGAASNSFTVAAGILLTGKSLDNTLIVLDGDVYKTIEEKEKQIKNILTGDDPINVERRETALKPICQYSIPDGLAPEKYLHQIITTASFQDEITTIAASIQAVNNTHEYINNIISHLGVQKDIGLFKIVGLLSKTQFWSDFVKDVKIALENLKTTNNL